MATSEQAKLARQGDLEVCEGVGRDGGAAGQPVRHPRRMVGGGARDVRLIAPEIDEQGAAVIGSETLCQRRSDDGHTRAALDGPTGHQHERPSARRATKGEVEQT